MHTRLSVCLLTIATTFGAGCSDDSGNGAVATSPRPVTVVRLEPRDFSRETHLTGSVGLYREEKIGFEVGGRVLAVVDVGKEVTGPAFDEQGHQVRPGDFIARLEDTRYRLHVQALEARLNALKKGLEAQRIDRDRVARANLQAAEARREAAVNDVSAGAQEVEAAAAALTLAHQTLERERRLLNQGAGKQQAVDDATGSYDRAVARKAQAESALLAKRSFLDAQRAGVATAEAAIVLKGAEVESTSFTRTVARSSSDFPE